VTADGTARDRVRLTWYEVAVAAHVGVQRQIEALARKLPDRHGRSAQPGWSDHIEGACGELACAKVLGVYWNPSVNTFKRDGDVATYEVRTRLRDDYELLVRDDDPSDRNYVLVRGQAPCFHVVGWLPGTEAKDPRWRKTHGGREPAFFVPDGDLFSTDILQKDW
jgi:hypothetical protein